MTLYFLSPASQLSDSLSRVFFTSFFSISPKTHVSIISAYTKEKIESPGPETLLSSLVHKSLHVCRGLCPSSNSKSFITLLTLPLVSCKVFCSIEITRLELPPFSYSSQNHSAYSAHLTLSSKFMARKLSLGVLH